MTDDTEEAETPSRRPGRPRGSRNATRQAVHRGRSDPRRSEAPPVKTITYTPYEPKSSTAIPTDIIQEIWDYYDGHLQWCVFEAAGKPTPEWISARQKNGFVDCRRGDFDGKLDYLCGSDGRMVVGGLVLMCRPREYEEQARAYEKRKAALNIEQMKQSHAEQGVNVKGGDHPSALAKNRHRQSYERVEIPE
jgi:hypothetical protein